MGTFDRAEIPELIEGLSHNVALVERLRALLRPLGMATSMLDELREFEPDIGPELDAAGEHIIEATGTLIAMVAVVDAKWKNRWGD